MGFPIRCFTCGKTIGHLYEIYKQRSGPDGEPAETVLDTLGVVRYCCRRMFTSHADQEKNALMYPTYPGRIQRLNQKNVITGDDDSESEEMDDSEEESEEESDEEESEEEDSDE